MLLFVDTADPTEVTTAVRYGCQGITTNPSLMARQGGDPVTLIGALCSRVLGPVSVECNATDAEGMVREGQLLAALHPQVVVKLPMGEAGLVAARRLSQQSVRTNITLCFTLSQVLLAARAHAAYVSPFVGRLDDRGQDGLALVRRSVAALAHHRLPTQVLAASVRHPDHVEGAFLAGSHAATLPPRLFAALAEHPLTDAGLEQFAADWRKSGAPSLLKPA